MKSNATHAVHPSCRVVSEGMCCLCLVACTQCSGGTSPDKKRRPVAINAEAKDRGKEGYFGT